MKKNYFVFSFVFVISMASLDAMKSVVKVMTYNIRREGKEQKEERMWKNRWPHVEALMKRFTPGVMGVQEATEHQIDDIKKSLPEYESFGEGRGSSWWGLATDEHTPVFYNVDLFELIDSNTFSINKQTGWTRWWTPAQVGTTGWLPRVCTWGKFRARSTGLTFYVYNTHLDHWYESARTSQLEVIKKHIDEHTNGLPVILMGDFNQDFDDEIKKVLNNFTDARSIARNEIGPRETRTGWDDDELKTIDHILINDTQKISVAQFVVLRQNKPYPSDHRPVMAKIEIRK